MLGACSKNLLIVLPAQAILVVIVVWVNHDLINPDAVAYIRIAQYHLSGQTDLMISGYWSPLLSWLTVPGLLVFDDPLRALHAAMAISAIVFLFGNFCVLRVIQLPDAATVIGTWIAALSTGHFFEDVSQL